MPYVTAQQLTWSLDFNTIFDNSEGDDKYTPAETIFQTRLSPEIGISLLNGTHNISGGVTWIQPIGDGWKDNKFCPTLYYRFNSPLWKFSMGMFPRTQLIEAWPGAFWSDKMVYNEPNIRGAMVQYTRANGYFEFFVDWRQMQSEVQREAFNINFAGNWSPKNKMFMLGGHLMMNHLAKQKNPPEDQCLCDNFLVNPYMGLNLAKKVSALDSFTVKAGMMMAVDRDREYSNWDVQKGAWAEVVAQWKFLGIKNTLYAGQRLMPYYTKFGPQLDLGDPFYQAKLYNRTNIYAYIIRNRFMNLEASIDFKVAKDQFNFAQKLLLRVYIDNKLWKGRKNNNYLKSPYLPNIM